MRQVRHPPGHSFKNAQKHAKINVFKPKLAKNSSFLALKTDEKQCFLSKKCLKKRKFTLFLTLFLAKNSVYCLIYRANETVTNGNFFGCPYYLSANNCFVPQQ